MAFFKVRVVGKNPVRTHHHASGDGNAPATVCVGNDVPISHTQEGDGNQPHSVEQIRMFFIVISVAGKGQGRERIRSKITGV